MYGNDTVSRSELERVKSDLEYQIRQLEDQVQRLREMLGEETENRRRENMLIYDALETKRDA